MFALSQCDHTIKKHGSQRYSTQNRYVHNACNQSQSEFSFLSKIVVNKKAVIEFVDAAEVY